jgi:hypothetical protein
MRFLRRTTFKSALALLCLQIGLIQAQFAPAQEPAPQAKPKMGQRGGFVPFRADPRVQMRSYHFEDTNENLEYALFVSSKVSKDRKNPLIVTLHGLGAGPSIMMTKEAVDLAEEGGYILGIRPQERSAQAGEYHRRGSTGGQNRAQAKVLPILQSQ